MSLESALEANTAAILALVSAVQGIASANVDSKPAATTTKADAPAPTRGRPKKPDDDAKPDTKADSDLLADESSNEYIELKKKVTKLASSTSPADAKKFVESLGVARLSELKQSQVAGAIEKVDELLNADF